MLFQNNEAANELLSDLAKFCTFILNGRLPDAVRPLFFGANLTALRKKDGGIRPIAAGNTLRRMVCRIVSDRLAKEMSGVLQPFQLGYACRGGAEAEAHAARLFASNLTEESILLKLDFRNAFNTVRRDHMVRCAQKYLPKYDHLISEMYRH